MRYLYRGSICTYISKARYVWKPKDFILLSSVVPKEWKVSFLDAAINRISEKDTLAWLQSEKPDAIVIAMSSIVWATDLGFLIKARNLFPKQKIYVFGEVFLEPSLVQQARQYADDVVFDPLRSDLVHMITEGRPGVYPHRQNGSRKETRELTTNIPRHELFDNVKYRWPFVRHFRFASVYTQFGCPFVCSYCTESITNVTYRPAENVLEEMRHLKERGYKEILIGDASFGYPRENALKIIEGMIREKFGFSWSSYVYPGLMDEKTIALMAESGCHTAVIGVDSADGALLEKYGRKLPEMKIRDFIDNCHKHGIDVCGDIILGFKEDTKESCLKTIHLAADLGLDYVSVNIATPLMGSAFRNQYKESGQLKQSATGFDTAGLNEVMDLDRLSAQDLVWLRNYAVQFFYLRPSYIWRKIKRISSLEEILIKANEGWGIVLNLIKQKRRLRDGYL